MERILSQFENFSITHGIDNPEINVDEDEIFIRSEILNFDIGSALIAAILCIGLIFVSENGFGYLLFIFSLLFCYIIWKKLQYVNTSRISLSEEKEILIHPKLIYKEHKIPFREIRHFCIKYIETRAAFRNYKIYITTTDGSEVKLIDFNNEDAAKDFAKLMNMLLKYK